jgi:hypothetical protein
MSAGAFPRTSSRSTKPRTSAHAIGVREFSGLLRFCPVGSDCLAAVPQLAPAPGAGPIALLALRKPTGPEGQQCVCIFGGFSQRPTRRQTRRFPGPSAASRARPFAASAGEAPDLARRPPARHTSASPSSPARPSRHSCAADSTSGRDNVMVLSGRPPLPLPGCRAAESPATAAVMLQRALRLLGLPPPAGRHLPASTTILSKRHWGRASGRAFACGVPRPCPGTLP